MSVSRPGGNVFLRMWNMLRSINKHQPAIKSTSDLPATNTGSVNQTKCLVPLQSEVADNQDRSGNHQMGASVPFFSLFNVEGRYQPFSTLFPRYTLPRSDSTFLGPLESRRTRTTRSSDGSYYSSLRPSKSKPFYLQQNYDACSKTYDHEFHGESNSDGVEVRERVSASPNYFCSSQIMTCNNGGNHSSNYNGSFFGPFDPGFHAMFAAMRVMRPLTGGSSFVVNALQPWFTADNSDFTTHHSPNTRLSLPAPAEPSKNTKIDEHKKSTVNAPNFKGNKSSNGIVKACEEGANLVFNLVTGNENED